MRGGIPPFPQYAVMVWCSEHRDNLTWPFVSNEIHGKLFYRYRYNDNVCRYN
jgi:hypothetical protein